MMTATSYGNAGSRERGNARFVSRMPDPGSRIRERGAALITVLLFVVLMFILITAMLTVTGNEIVIAGLQKDGMRATELAQAGIQEAIARVAAGRPYTGAGGWTASIDPRVTVTVTRVFPGANSAYLQIDATAADVAKWYPGTRRTTPAASADGGDILGFEADAESTPCNATGPTYNQTLPGGALFVNNAPGSGVKQYGFDPDTPAGKPSQLDPDLFPCGLPFKYISEVVYDENLNPLVDGTCASPPGGVGGRWYKTVVFEEWYENYWRFDETQMTAVKRGGGVCVDGICVKNDVADASPSVQPNLLAYPEFGAVPPFPDMTSITNNYDCKYYSPTGASIPPFPVPCTRPDGSTTMSDLG